MKTIIISGPKIYSENGVIENAALVIKNNLIHDIIAQNEIKKFSSAECLEFPHDFYLVPGFIDLHVHGADGKDVMDASPDALAVISQALAKEGTTSFLAATMTSSKDHIENALINIANTATTAAEMIGVHLEGPFISPQKAGCQLKDPILLPDINLMRRWQRLAKQKIKMVTVAPEQPNCLDFISYLQQEKIIASIGHSDADYQQSLDAIAAGCQHATHLFNAMRGIHQREPGAVTAALMSDKVMAELIVDGIHLHPAIVNLVYRIKGKHKINLVTDAMRAKCLCDGTYELGGQSVHVKNNAARLSDGTLAGSILKMSSAISNMMKFTGCSLQDVLFMASANPAKALGIYHKKGSIAAQKDADIVVLDSRLDVVMTVCCGKVIYSAN